MTEPQSLTGYERDNGAGWNVPGNLDVSSLSINGTPFTPGGGGAVGAVTLYSPDVLVADGTHVSNWVVNGTAGDTSWFTHSGSVRPDWLTLATGVYVVGSSATIQNPDSAATTQVTSSFIGDDSASYWANTDTVTPIWSSALAMQTITVGTSDVYTIVTAGPFVFYAQCVGAPVNIAGIEISIVKIGSALFNDQ